MILRLKARCLSPLLLLVDLSPLTKRLPTALRSSHHVKVLIVVAPLCGVRVPLSEFDMTYHIAAVAEPFAVLFRGFFLHPYFALLNQFAEFDTPAYDSCGGRFAEHHAEFVKRRGDKLKAVFGAFKLLYVFGEGA